MTTIIIVMVCHSLSDKLSRTSYNRDDNCGKKVKRSQQRNLWQWSDVCTQLHGLEQWQKKSIRLRESK